LCGPELWPRAGALVLRARRGHVHEQEAAGDQWRQFGGRVFARIGAVGIVNHGA
jgi:hypothetical protein